jgi:Ca2+-binding EF-hand superfamily protein
MVGILLASLALMMASGGQAAPAAPDEPAKNVGKYLFISPMGEPFRADRDPQDIWFDQADTNHDGALSLAEFKKDAMRWFLVLDRGHDGEIDPDDIEYYESILVPEIRVDSDEGDTEVTSSSDDEGASTTVVHHNRKGAALYSYLDYPEPVMVADTNFNRGVDPREFDHAAEVRFAILDVNHDGKIERAELPKISAVAVNHAEKKGKRHH